MHPGDKVSTDRLGVCTLVEVESDRAIVVKKGNKYYRITGNLAKIVKAAPKQATRKPRICKVPECEQKHYGYGLCERHYYEAKHKVNKRLYPNAKTKRDAIIRAYSEIKEATGILPIISKVVTATQISYYTVAKVLRAEKLPVIRPRRTKAEIYNTDGTKTCLCGNVFKPKISWHISRCDDCSRVVSKVHEYEKRKKRLARGLTSKGTERKYKVPPEKKQ